MKAITKKDALYFFQKIDGELENLGKRVQITVLGGLAIILQGFRDRSTLDIDIAPTSDAKTFSKICQKLKIPVDIITISSTVDFVHTETNRQFSGKFLMVNSVSSKDLIKLKLERFRKQDPEDIMAIIDKINLSYDSFQNLVKEMLADFIGDPRFLILSAQDLIERKFPEHLEIFVKFFK